MNRYNLYYKGQRINSKPVSENDMKRIARTNKPVRKMTDGIMQDIPLDKIRVVKCTIV